MAIAIISDIHVLNRHDNGHYFLMDFFKSKKVQGCDSIFLLGDIFDFLCGQHKEYFDEFPEFFEEMKGLLEKGKSIYYIEGNHDFHLAPLFEQFLQSYKVRSKQLYVSKEGIFKVLWNKKYYFGHGDEINVNDYIYQFYKKILNSNPLQYLANGPIPYGILKAMGQFASGASRKNNQRKQYDYSSIRKKFRKGVEELGHRIQTDFIICGHSHVRDDYVYDDFGLSFRYLNNGYALDSKTFLYIDFNQPEFIFL